MSVVSDAHVACSPLVELFDALQVEAQWVAVFNADACDQFAFVV